MGQNGAGKTTLLKLIADIADNPGINGFYNYIAVFYDGKKYIGYSYSSSVHKSLDVKHNPVEMEFDNYSFDENGVLEYRFIASARCLYYSDSFTEAQAEFSRYYKSFSTLSFLRGSYIDNMTFDWQITTFFEKEFIRQLRLIGDYKNIIEKFHIRYCPYISTFFSISYDLLDNWIEVFLDKDPVRRDKDEKYLHGIINKFLFDIVETKGMDRFKSNLAYAVFCTIVHHLSNDISKFKRKQFDSIINIMKFPKSKDVWNRVLDLLNDEFWIKGENIFLLPNRKELIGFMKFIDEKAKFSKDAFRNYSFSVGFTIPIVKENNNENYDFQTDIETFYNEYRRAVGLFNFLDFSWGLSSGEMSLLNIFSRLYRKVKKIDSPDRKEIFFLPQEDNEDRPVENVLLIMDEIENNLHPDWQRILIKAFLEFVNVSFTGTNVHIIMATHSPIMLSDVPKQNVIYLTQDKESGKTCVDPNENHKETFSSNIFKLYNDAFFMKEGAIGAFAEEKLINLLYLITSDNVDDKKEEIKRQIEFIGDPFLKQKFKAKFMKHLSIQNQIAEHEKIIAELKKKAAKTDKNDEK